MRVTQPFLQPSLIALAATQRGVFTAHQAYQAGHTQRQIQELRKGEHLVSVRRGVYALQQDYLGADAAQRHRVQVAALSLVLTPKAVVSHASAAIEHDVDMLDPDLRLLHVTRQVSSGTRVEAGVKHHAADLPERHVVRRQGLLDLATRARTAIDVARESTRFECAVAVMDSALRAGVPKTELEEVFALSRTWPGARLASGALPLADGRAANPGESWCRVVLVQQGVAPDDLQVPVHDSDGLIGYVDFGWDGVLGEFDGKAKYAIGVDTDPKEAARIVWREKLREDRLRDQGFEVVRWTYADLCRPEVVGARVRRALARVARRRRSAG